MQESLILLICTGAMSRPFTLVPAHHHLQARMVLRVLIRCGSNAASKRSHLSCRLVERQAVAVGRENFVSIAKISRSRHLRGS